MPTLIQDVCSGLRALRRNPGFATIAVVTLAFGIGAKRRARRRLDLEELTGAWPVSAPGDANCCPPLELPFTVRLVGDAMVLDSAGSLRPRRIANSCVRSPTCALGPAERTLGPWTASTRRVA